MGLARIGRRRRATGVPLRFRCGLSYRFGMPKRAERVASPLRRARPIWLLGPALVAGVAYLDPGNVASNMTAGARYGYLLVWVVVLGNVMAWLIQYLSAKLGIVTGQSLPELLGARFRTHAARRAYSHPSTAASGVSPPAASAASTSSSGSAAPDR